MKIIKIYNCKDCVYCRWCTYPVMAVCSQGEFCIDNPEVIDKRCKLETAEEKNK